MKKAYDMQDIHDYRDIMDRPHPVSNKHPRMARIDRAAQFAPFAALTGHKEAVKESERQTEQKRMLSDGQKLRINEVLQEIQNRRKQHPIIRLTYFVKDPNKEGGTYITIRKSAKRIEEIEKRLVLMDGTRIAIPDIYQIEIIEEAIDPQF